MSMRIGLAAVALVLAPYCAQADEITEQLDLARELYEENDIVGAVTELEFTLQALRGKIAEAYVETLPGPPQGWSALDAEQQAGAAFIGGGTMISRQYQAEDGNGSIEAQLIVDNPMIQGFAAMMGNPAMVGAQTGMERVRIGRDNAILQFNEDDGSGEATLVLGRAMVKLTGNGLQASDPLVSLLKSWDIQRVKELAGS